MARAPDSKSGCWGFESLLACQINKLLKNNKGIMPVNLKNMMDSIVRFYGEVKAEAKKIVWPLRKETVASTAVVVVIVLIVSFYLGIVDAILSRAVKLILS